MSKDFFFLGSKKDSFNEVEFGYAVSVDSIRNEHDGTLTDSENGEDYIYIQMTNGEGEKHTIKFYMNYEEDRELIRKTANSILKKVKKYEKKHGK
jgi:hypothetical protein